jgi:hypothetical protein
MPMTKEQLVDALKEKITTPERLTEIMTAAGFRGLREAQRSFGGNGASVMARDLSELAFPHGTAHEDYHRYVSDETRGTAVYTLPSHLWWILRERLRMVYGVYPTPTNSIERLLKWNHTMNYCVHISTQDPTLVAYTPSPQDGAMDKQVRLSLGKLLR